MALGLDREISDIEEDEEAVEHYEYKTEMDEVIEEDDKEYLEHLDLEESARADPAPEEEEEEAAGEEEEGYE